MYILGLLALAIAPGLAIMVFIYFRDKYEKEPLSYLFISFIMGIGSAFLAIVMSLSANAFYNPGALDITGQFFSAFFVVALAEESAKYFFLRRFNFLNRHFNEPFDGIVYSVMISMGFATFENIIYTLQYGAGTGILRMFTAVPAHATFAVIMGYFVGLAKFSGRKTLYGLLGLAGAILFHGAYDFFLFISFVPGIYIGAFVSLLIGVLLSFRAIKLHQLNSPFRK